MFAVKKNIIIIKIYFRTHSTILLGELELNYGDSYNRITVTVNELR